MEVLHLQHQTHAAQWTPDTGCVWYPSVATYAASLTHYMGTTGAALGLSGSCTDAIPGAGIFSRLLLLLGTSAVVRQTGASRRANPRAQAVERMSVQNSLGRMRLVLRIGVWVWALPGCRCCFRVGWTYTGTYPSPLITEPANMRDETGC